MRVLLALAALTIAHATAPAQEEGWPAHMHDGRRSGVTTERLSLPLHPQWRARSSRPSPAWPAPAPGSFWQELETLQPRVTFDAVFQPVAVGESVWFASSSDDHVYCLDANDGAVRWSFAALAPIRFAPAIAGERVFVASDDGFVYCLRRDDGALLWQRRLAPEPTLIPGNGRLVSAWPVRTGLVVDDECVYCTVGLFPSQGTWAFALDAVSGEVRWKAQLPSELSPQGYLLLSPTRLFVPNGRAMPFAFGREDGAFRGAFGGPGGAWALLVDDALVSGPSDAGELAMARTETRETLASFRGNRMVVRGATSFLQTDTQLVALDRVRRVAQPDAGNAVAWSVPCRHPHSLILAGDTLFAGGDGEVGAYSAASGELLWTGEVEGRALGLAVAAGRLFVSTDQGLLAAFAAEKAAPPTSVEIPALSPSHPGKVLRYEGTAQHLSRHVRTGPLGLAAKEPARPILRMLPAVWPSSRVTPVGYALVLDAIDGELAMAIGTWTGLRVVMVARTEEHAAELRRTRSSWTREPDDHFRFLVCDEKTLPFPDGFANLVISEHSLLTGVPPRNPREMLRVTAPYGGAALLRDPRPRAELQAELEAAFPGEMTIVSEVPFARKLDADPAARVGGQYLVRRGPPPGAGQWTHAYADAGNTSCSDDRLVANELALQWFGAPGPGYMVDRHLRTTPPLARDGRLFVPGRDRVMVVDAYNGAWLWGREVEGFTRTGAPYDGGQWAVGKDGLFLAADGVCLELELHLGGVVRELSAKELSGGTKSHWGWLALTEGTLLGSAQKLTAARRDQSRREVVAQYREQNAHVVSDAVFAVDLERNERRWLHADGVVLNTSLAAAEERVFLLRSRAPAAVDDEDGRVPLERFLGAGCELVALDLAAGTPLWTIPFPEDRFRHSLFFACDRNVLVAAGSYNEDGRNVYALLAFDATSGTLLWRAQHDNNRGGVGGDHGEQVHHPVLTNGLVVAEPRIYDLRTGAPADPQETGESFFLPARGGCGTISGSASCLFFRDANPAVLPLVPGGERGLLTRVSRPGCWISILPVGGLVLLPEASCGCVCAFPLQTSMALRPR